MIGIVFALAREAPRLGGRAAIAISKPGQANARQAAERLIAQHPLTALISAGYAGALTPSLRIGDIVVDTNVPEWKALAEKRRATLGRVTTIDRMIQTAAERRELAASTGALAVDMEAAGVAEAACRHQLPFAAIKAITDTPERDLVLNWNACRRPDGSFSTMCLIRQALSSTQGVAEMFQLWYASRLASGNLRRFLLELLGGHGFGIE